MATIAIDIDDVLIPFYQSLAEWHNRKHSTQLQSAQLASTRLSEGWGEDDDYWTVICNDFHSSTEGSVQIPVSDDIKQAVELLAKDHSLHLVTQRPYLHKSNTREWARRELGDWIEDVHMNSRYGSAEETLSLDKGELCKKIGADLLIDDAINHVDNALKHGLEALLFGEYSWNIEHKPYMNRVKNWEEVVHAIHTGK